MVKSKPSWESRKRHRNDSSDQDHQKVEEEDFFQRSSGLKSSTAASTAEEYLIPSELFLALPPEIRNVDFTKRVCWRKFSPYTDISIPLTPLDQTAEFTPDSPALCFHVNAISGRARATTLHFHSDRKVRTPIFMPVG